jgi:uncharacterized HAD superfamily protein
MENRTSPTIAIDLDGVLGNIAQQLVRFSAAEYSLNLLQRTFTSENIETCTSINQQQLHRLFASPSFFRTMSPIRGASKWVHFLRSRGSKISIITDRFWYEGIQQDTIEWLHTHQIPYDTIAFARKEAKQDFVKELRIDWFIEDQLSNAKLLSSVCKVVLIDRPYNKGDLPYGAVRVKNLQNAVSVIKARL